MVKTLSANLKAMGIPFFGTRSELVRVRGQGEKVGVFTIDGAADEREKEDGKIDEEDLIGLQRKMLEILEDMCEA